LSVVQVICKAVYDRKYRNYHGISGPSLKIEKPCAGTDKENAPDQIFQSVNQRHQSDNDASGSRTKHKPHHKEEKRYDRQAEAAYYSKYAYEYDKYGSFIAHGRIVGLYREAKYM
jgi:hypothetical protein